MKKLLAILLLLIVQIGFAQTNDYLDISKKLVEAAMKQNQKAAAEYMSLIKQMKNTLSNLMVTPQKKAFFINVYNGFTNISLRKNPAQYKDRGTFFKSEYTHSWKNKPDIIEHGF
jgi:hypothetical protein